MPGLMMVAFAITAWWSRSSTLSSYRHNHHHHCHHNSVIWWSRSPSSLFLSSYLHNVIQVINSIIHHITFLLIQLTLEDSGTECDIRMDFDTNEYPNIFVSRKWHEWISEYIRMIFLTQTNIPIYLYQTFDTNEYPNKYLDQKYSNIRIYSSHSGLEWHQFCAFTI